MGSPSRIHSGTPDSNDYPRVASYGPRTKSSPQRTEGFVSVSQPHNVETTGLDGGRCLITNVRHRGITIQCVHVVPQATPNHKLRRMEIAWGLSDKKLDLTTSGNLIYLDRNWHASFDVWHWALVPQDSVLSEIVIQFDKAIEKGTRPSPSHSSMSTKQTGTPYTLVFFEPLAGYIYPRANDNHTAFKKITVNKTGVSPPFLHHCHPYFAIQNAIPKFLKHEATLTEKQKEIHLRLKIVEKAWDDYFDKVTSAKLDPPGAVGGPAADDAEDDNSGDDDGGAIGPPLKRPRITEDPSSNKNAGDRHVAPGAEDTNAYRHSKRPGLPLPPPTNPPHEDKREREDEDDKDEEKWLFRHSDWSHVTAWLADVPEECDSMEEQSVAWLVDEILRPPLQPPTTRDNWSNPPDTSKFSSTNWATWIKGNLLDYPMSPTGSWNESSSKSSS